MRKMIRSVVQSSRKSRPISAELTEEESQKLLMLKIESNGRCCSFYYVQKGESLYVLVQGVAAVNLSTLQSCGFFGGLHRSLCYPKQIGMCEIICC